MKDIVIVILIIALIIVGSVSYHRSQTDKDSIRAYIVDDIHYIIGFGKWDSKDGKKFQIYSVWGQTWDIGPEVKIETMRVTPDFIPKQTR